MANYTKMLGKYPVEMALFTLFTLYLIGYELVGGEFNDGAFGFVPAIMMAYIINNMSFTWSKQLYRCSWLSIIFFFPLYSADVWVEGKILLATALFPILAILSRRRADNERFVDEVLRYLFALVEAWLFALVLMLILVGINESIFFIFDIGGHYSSDINDIIGKVCVAFIAPSLFFSSLMNNLDRRVEFGKSLEFFVNYIISLPLIIYTVMLYIYIIKIGVIWELPKGGVAMMVMVFMLCNAIVSSLQGYLKQPIFSWFFQRINYISIPLMLMFWVAASRRVVDFGFTQDRVYLFIVGAIATIYMLMFISKRLANYYRFMWVAFGIISAVTFIPMLAPKELAITSQYNILIKSAKSADMLGIEHKFIMVKRDSSDIKYVEKYKRIESAIDYLRSNDRCGYVEDMGVNSFSNIRDKIISDASIKSMYNKYSGDNKCYFSIYTYDDSRMINISGYKYFFRIDGAKEGDKCYYKYTDDVLNIYLDNELIFSMDIDEIYQIQSSKVGKSDYYLYSNSNKIDSNIVKDILLFENEVVIIEFKSFNLNYYKDVDRAKLDYYPGIKYIIIK